MMNSDGDDFEKIIRWDIGEKVRHDVIKKMDIRAQHEKEEFLGKCHEGISFRDIHKEAVSRGERYRELIYSIIRTIDIPENSICADLGAGTGTLAALISLQTRVKRVYAVEISEKFTTDIMPLTFDYFKARRDKIRRVIGDFNRLKFEDETIDFTVETGSFHHSEDISGTLSECHRVLKPGGFLLAIERAWPNFINNFRKNSVLNKELSDDLKKKYGIPMEESFTRGMWGEHEFTFEEWNILFREAGFKPKMLLLKPFAVIPPFRYLLKKLCSSSISSLEPFYVKTGKHLLWNPYLYYELLKIPIFICTKSYG